MSTPPRHCLVIPDIHQNIRWTEAILDKEAAAADKIVFLGDYFDTKVDSAADVAKTCQYLSQLHKRLASKSHFLLGNHDLPYLYDLQNERSPKSHLPNPYFNGAYNAYLTESIRPNLSAAFLTSLEPFTHVQGWILSHAGIHPHHLETNSQTALDTLYQKLKAQIAKLPDERPKELAAIGTARGGAEEHGGILWQDWFNEFEDLLEWPQIVGHTLIAEPNKKGRSWNLDTKNGSYGILTNGELEIRTEPKEA